MHQRRLDGGRAGTGGEVGRVGSVPISTCAPDSLLPRQRAHDLHVPAAVAGRGLQKSRRVARERQHGGRRCDGAAGVVGNRDGRGIDDGVWRERDAAGVVHGAGDRFDGAGLVEDRGRARDRELCSSLHHCDLHGSAQTHHHHATFERGGDRQRSTIGARDIRNLRLW